MITKKLAQLVLNECLSTGADFSEIFLEDTTTFSLSCDNGVIETVSSTQIKGAGIRLIKDLKSVYGNTNILTKK